ncbi:MAG: UPF0147 family protein [Nanoarchaeota archaeon]
MTKKISDNEKILEVTSILQQIEADCTMPKNTRSRVKEAINNLNDEKDINLKIDKIMQHLDDIANDPNLPNYARTQIWNMISVLESL